MVAWRRERDRRSAWPAKPRLRVVTARPPDAPLPRVSRAELPDYADYRDTGCDVSPSCLRCPLPRCKFDVPPPPRPDPTAARDREIRARRRQGATARALARDYGLTRRTIFRILREQSEQSGGS